MAYFAADSLVPGDWKYLWPMRTLGTAGGDGRSKSSNITGPKADGSARSVFR